MANHERYFTPVALPGIETDRTWESDFMKAHPEHLADGNAMGFISDNGGENYNLCHCKSFTHIRHPTTGSDVGYHAVWSNFEVADMDFWRAPAYTAYVDYLEASGGFYYEVCTSSLSLPSDAHSTHFGTLAVGRCAGSQPWGRLIRAQGPNPLFRRNWV